MIVKTLKILTKKSQEEIDALKILLKDKELTQPQRRSLAAKILGVHRRHKQRLIVEITGWALEADQSPASNHKVEQWQETHFGRSISNNKLSKWCDDSRSPGDRAEFNISEETTNRAKELFSIFAEALKNQLDEPRLKKISGDILCDEIGL